MILLKNKINMNKSISVAQSDNAIVLLHGFGFDSSIWRDLNEDHFPGYSLFMPDIPGFGKAEVPDSFKLSDVGQQLLHWLLSRGVFSCHLVGHSMGGYIALEMARAHPELVSSLTLLHSHCYADHPDKQKDRMRKAKFIKRHGTEAFLTLFYPSVFKDQAIPLDFIPLLERYENTLKPAVLAGYLEAMATRRDNHNVLERLPVPVHLIHGRFDGLISLSDMYKMSTLPTICTLHILENSGHMSMYEDPGLGPLLSALICDKAC